MKPKDIKPPLAVAIEKAKNETTTSHSEDQGQEIKALYQEYFEWKFTKLNPEKGRKLLTKLMQQLNGIFERLFLRCQLAALDEPKIE